MLPLPDSTIRFPSTTRTSCPASANSAVDEGSVIREVHRDGIQYTYHVGREPVTGITLDVCGYQYR